MKTRQQQKNQPIFTRSKAALLAGALALALLPGCAAEPFAPVVTEDDLTPSSTAQQVIAQVADNGKTYAYVTPDWTGDWDTREAELRQRNEQELEALQELLDTGKVDTIGLTVEEAEKQLEILRDPSTLESQLAQERAAWQEQQGLDPVISAQEAANRAGWMFEEAYGIDLSGRQLTLNCFRSTGTNSGMFEVSAGPGDGRVMWEARVDPDDFHGNITCVLDATTGEFSSAGYAALSEEENERILQSPKAECYLPDRPDDPAAAPYHWDPDAPSYPQTVADMKAEMQATLSGSPLVGGAQVTGIEEELTHENHSIHLNVTCDDGKAYRLEQVSPGMGKTGDAYGGYPLRAYSFMAVSAAEG